MVYLTFQDLRIVLKLELMYLEHLDINDTTYRSYRSEKIQRIHQALSLSHCVIESTISSFAFLRKTDEGVTALKRKQILFDR